MRFIILINLLCASIIFSQSTLTIQDALDYAIKNNPELNQLNEQINITSALRLNSFGLYPLKFSFMQEGMPNLPDDIFAEKRQSLSQNIDFPLTSFFRYKISSAAHDAALLQYQQARLNKLMLI